MWSAPVRLVCGESWPRELLELTVTKKTILTITTVMTIVEFVAVTGYIFANEHDLAFSLILGAPAAILMFVILGVSLTIVYYRR